MEAWQITIITVVVPVIISAGLPFFAQRSQRRQAKRLSDVEFGSKLRDELRADIDRLRKELDDIKQEKDDCHEEREGLRREVAQLRHDLTRLEERVRRGTGDAFGGGGSGERRA